LWLVYEARCSAIPDWDHRVYAANLVDQKADIPADWSTFRKSAAAVY